MAGSDGECVSGARRKALLGSTREENPAMFSVFETRMLWMDEANEKRKKKCGSKCEEMENIFSSNIEPFSFTQSRPRLLIFLIFKYQNNNEKKN